VTFNKLLSAHHTTGAKVKSKWDNLSKKLDKVYKVFCDKRLVSTEYKIKKR